MTCECSEFVTNAHKYSASVANCERMSNSFVREQHTFQRMLRMLSVAVNFRKHSQAIGKVGKAFGSIGNIRETFARRL